MKLWMFVLRRIAILIPTLIGLTLLVFVLIHLQGNNLILSEYLNPRLTGQARELAIQRLTQEFHLNQPVYIQYFYWLAQVFSGNFGYTNTPIFSGPVSTAIVLFLPNTVILSLFAALLIWLIGIPLGVFSAVNRDSAADQGIRVFSFTLYSMPIYLIAIALILILGVYTGILPFSGEVSPQLVSGLPWYVNGISYPTHVLLIDAIIHGDFAVAWNAFLHLIMPALTLALAVMAGIIRILRASMLETLEQDYIKLARAKGVPEKVVNNLHARKSAMLPVVTSFGYTVAGLLGGVVVVETVFDFPGIGYWTTQALLNDDVGGVMASTLIFGIILVVTTLVLDIIYAIIDPRIRY
ncbi:peptide ABC transporter permease [Metallosphaera sedula]|uniref:Peptide ABC transporter permease n=2 Tax=Metallosphaera TaxID=41980 RepID=A0A0K1SZC5_9CREN|nr:peptide ABC transporter permease [Metallosphaera sedula]QCO31276.1 ABC transporter permease [Metallosphaera prunae]AKV77667.1 peptide ABC transporter permease [Metallosphaera sedula]AKV79913.1 peptide ABC transporter permease [Metallosphaera sedula]AKV82158.1 peptide ABC transporter permease [Metallosphaera sedula]